MFATRESRAQGTPRITPPCWGQAQRHDGPVGGGTTSNGSREGEEQAVSRFQKIAGKLEGRAMDAMMIASATAGCARPSSAPARAWPSSQRTEALSSPTAATLRRPARSLQARRSAGAPRRGQWRSWPTRPLSSQFHIGYFLFQFN